MALPTPAPKPNTPTPTTAPAAAPIGYTLDQIKKFAADPSTIPTGVGGVQSVTKMFDTMKKAVQSGQMTLPEFQGLSAPLGKAGAQMAGNISRGGSSAADSVKSAWQQLNTYVDGNGKSLQPFSPQEYAQLPDNVLPTQNDINTGMFDPTNQPIQRLKSVAPGQPGATPAPTDQAGNNAVTSGAPQTPNAQVGNSPVYSANPNAVSPYGGLQSTNGSASNDAQRIAQEAALQQQLSVQNQEGVTSKRQQYMSDLTGLLNQNAQKQMSEATPGIYEDLNSRGLLRSSAVGDALATKSKSLQADVANKLGQYGVQGETADLGNLTNIQSTYNAARDSALGREYSVEDYNRQVQTGKELGEQYSQLKPNAPSKGKSALSGAATGASAMAATGDPYAIAGGAAAGGLAGGTKG